MLKILFNEWTMLVISLLSYQSTTNRIVGAAVNIKTNHKWLNKAALLLKHKKKPAIPGLINWSFTILSSTWISFLFFFFFILLSLMSRFYDLACSHHHKNINFGGMVIIKHYSFHVFSKRPYQIPSPDPLLRNTPYPHTYGIFLFLIYLL